MSNNKQSMKLYIKQKLKNIIEIYNCSTFLKESTLFIGFLLLLWAGITFEWVITSLAFFFILIPVYFVIKVIIIIIKDRRNYER